MGNFIIMKKKKENPPQYVPGRDSKVLTVSASEWQNNKEVHLCKVSCQHSLRISPISLVFTLHSPHFLKMDTFSRITNMCRRDKSSTRCFGICLSDQMTAFDGLWIGVQIKDTARDHRGWQQIFTSSGETIGEQMEREGGSKRHCLSNGPLCCLICSWWNKETRRTEGGEHEQVMRSSKGAGSEDAQPQRKAATVFVSN